MLPEILADEGFSVENQRLEPVISTSAPLAI
jgi:hypothetical protein